MDRSQLSIFWPGRRGNWGHLGKASCGNPEITLAMYPRAMDSHVQQLKDLGDEVTAAATQSYSICSKLYFYIHPIFPRCIPSYLPSSLSPLPLPSKIVQLGSIPFASHKPLTNWIIHFLLWFHIPIKVAAKKKTKVWPRKKMRHPRPIEEETPSCHYREKKM